MPLTLPILRDGMFADFVRAEGYKCALSVHITCSYKEMLIRYWEIHLNSLLVIIEPLCGRITKALSQKEAYDE